LSEEINIVDDDAVSQMRRMEEVVNKQNVNDLPPINEIEFSYKFIEPGLANKITELQREVVLGNITEDDRRLGHDVLIQIRNWEDFAYSQGWFKQKRTPEGKIVWDLDEDGKFQFNDTVQTEIKRYLTEFGYLFNSSRSLGGRAARESRSSYSRQESAFEETPPKMGGTLGKIQKRFF